MIQKKVYIYFFKYKVNIRVLKVHQVQLLSSIDRINGNEQINQSENNTSVAVASIGSK
jgi:hypothetical protein